MTTGVLVGDFQGNSGGGGSISVSNRFEAFEEEDGEKSEGGGW